jgi:hypothetical protein
VLPLETESAALGVALQAAAVHRGIPVDDFISTMKTPVAKVSTNKNSCQQAWDGPVPMHLCCPAPVWHHCSLFLCVTDE